jgi:dihydrofolate reductase
MPILHAIAAMSENRVIGVDGKIPWHLPEDFRWFKHKTMDGALIMGRRTCASLGRPLPGRDNLVLSRDPKAKLDGFRFFSEIEKVLLHVSANRTGWVIGGGEIYAQLLPRCHFLYLTRVKRKVDGDVLLPAFEGAFELNQLIHENADFRVERWLNREGRPAPTDPEGWPF